MRAYLLLFSFLPQGHALRLLTAEFQVSSAEEPTSTSTSTSSTEEPTPAPLPGHNAPAEMKMGGAFGGGGCYSAISQLGFLRGLLADDIGTSAPAMKLTNFASSSGGSWALGMFFNSAKPGGILDVYTQGEQIKTNKDVENKLGTWCMFHNFRDKKKKDQWSAEMQFCGKYDPPKNKDGSIDNSHIRQIPKGKLDTLFGIAQRCLKEDWPLDKLLQPGTIRKQSGKGDFFELSGPGRQAWVAKKMLDQYEQFFKDTEHESKEQWFDKKLSDLAPKFKSEKYGDMQWSIFYSHWNTIVPPLAMSSSSPASTGPVTQSDDNLARAIFYSSDAFGAIIPAVLLGIEVSLSCPVWSKFLEWQTGNNYYPFPFGGVFQTPLSSLLETQSTNVSSIKIPLHLLQNEKGSSSDSLIEFFLNVSAEERRQALSLTFPAWNTDGLGVDNNAVGEALRLMDKVEDSARPKTFVSLITGLIDKGNELQVREVLRYFQKETRYGDMIPFGFADVMEAMKCGVRDQKVNNPNYFFELEDWGLDDKLSQSEQARCTAEVMLSEEADSKCWNFRHQMETTGTVFARKVKVLKNKFWGLKGGWDLTIMFTILNTNQASRDWVDDIFPVSEKGDYQHHESSKAEREHLKTFPIATDGKVGLMGVEPLYGFALMNYNAFKGYLSHCALIAFQTQGQQQCLYCSEEFKNEKECEEKNNNKSEDKKEQCKNDCKKWLPFLDHRSRHLL
jgi:hypothetical protein